MKNLKWIILVAILVLAAAVRLWDFAAPWTDDYRGWGGSFYGNAARNYVRFGYLDTKAAPVRSVNPPDPAHFEYYLDHPPMTAWLVSLSFRVFGESEWAARLVAVLCSLGALALLYAIMIRFWKIETVLVMLAVAAVAPMAAFYGSFVDAQGPVPMFFALLVLWLYFRFDERRTWGRWLAVLAAFVPAALSDWPAYYVVPLIVAHHFFSKARGSERTGRRWRVLLLPALALAMFAAFVLYFNRVERGVTSFNVDEMVGLFTERALATTHETSGENFTFGGWLARMWDYLHVMFTFPALVLAGGGLVFYAFKSVSRYRDRGDGALAVFLAFGLMHVLIFRQGAYVHEFWGYYLYPAVAMLVAAALGRLCHFRVQWPRTVLPRPDRAKVKKAGEARLRNVFYCAMALAVCASCFLSFLNLQDTRRGADYARLGMKLSESLPRDRTVLAEPNVGNYWNYRFAFYLGNHVEYAPPYPPNVQAAGENGAVFIIDMKEDPDLRDFKMRLLRHGREIAAAKSARVVDVAGLSPEMGEVEIPRPCDVAAEYKDGRINVRWKYDRLDEVRGFNIYSRTDAQMFFSDRVFVGRETEVSGDYRLRRPVTIAVTAVDMQGRETGYTQSVRLIP